MNQAVRWLGRDSAALVQSMIGKSSDPASGLIAALAGLAGLLVGSTTALLSCT